MKDYLFPTHEFYPAIFTYEEGKDVSVVLPDFGVSTSGTDEVDALVSAEELLDMTIRAKLNDDLDGVPVPNYDIGLKLEPNQKLFLVRAGVYE